MYQFTIDRKTICYIRSINILIHKIKTVEKVSFPHPQILSNVFYIQTLKNVDSH